MRHSLAIALIPLAFAFPQIVLAEPASAQDAGEKVNQLIVYGDDPCPPSKDGEITVCARKAESERFRIPAPLRESGDLQKNEAWNNKVIAYETVGSFGTRSCSPVGAGGSLGCTEKLINNAYAEKRESSDVRFSELIQAERERRLATIDQEAAATQGRVEAAEKEYEARQRASQDAGSSDTSPSPPPASLPTTRAPGS
ncbi:MAG: hypothetical protein ACTHLU_08795 [Novosphingobium sp.]